MLPFTHLQTRKSTAAFNTLNRVRLLTKLRGLCRQHPYSLEYKVVSLGAEGKVVNEPHHSAVSTTTDKEALRRLASDEAGRFDRLQNTNGLKSLKLRLLGLFKFLSCRARFLISSDTARMKKSAWKSTWKSACYAGDKRESSNTFLRSLRSKTTLHNFALDS